MLSRVLNRAITRSLPARSFASFARFDFEDALNFEGQLTDEERMIGETAKQFAYEKLLPRITKAY